MTSTAPQSFSTVFNPSTCLPWYKVSEDTKKGFNESLYMMRSKFMMWWCVSFAVPVIFIMAIGAGHVSILGTACVQTQRQWPTFVD